MEKTKLNVLFVHDRPSGGAGESLFQLVNHEAWDSVVLFASDGPLMKRFQSIRGTVPVHLMPCNSWLYSRGKGWANYLITQIVNLYRHIRFVRTAILLIRKHKIDIVHSNSLYTIGGAIAAKWTGRKHCLQVRELISNGIYSYPIPKKTLVSTLNYWSDKLVGNSQKTRESLGSYGIIPLSKLEVIYNLVEESNGTSGFRTENGFDANDFLIAQIGWVRPLKRVEIFLEMANKFREEEGMKFLIVGDYGKDESYNQKIREKLQTLPNAVFMGFVPEARDIMHELDLIISPCEIESFGRTLAEGLAAGTPVIGTLGSGAEEIIDDGETGFLIQPRDIQTGVELIKRIKTENLGQKMGSEGKVRMKKRFGSETILNDYLTLYLKVLDK